MNSLDLTFIVLFLQNKQQLNKFQNSLLELYAKYSNFKFHMFMLIIYDTMQFKFRISNFKNSNEQCNICRSWSKPVSNEMTRVNPCSFSYKLVYKIKFDEPIRDPHVYQETQTPQKR